MGRRFNLITLCSKGTWKQGTGVRLQHLFLIKLQIPGTSKAHTTLTALSPTVTYNALQQIFPNIIAISPKLILYNLI